MKEYYWKTNAEGYVEMVDHMYSYNCSGNNYLDIKLAWQNYEDCSPNLKQYMVDNS